MAATHQTPPTEPIEASIDAMGWLSGHWRGERSSICIEEWWSDPDGGMMLGMFRMIEGGAPRFYELLTLEPDEGRLVLRIKHFDPALVGWEESDAAVTLDLVALVDGEAVFLTRGSERWMVYRRNPATGELVAYFETAEHPHTDGEDEFRYARR